MVHGLFNTSNNSQKKTNKQKTKKQQKTPTKQKLKPNKHTHKKKPNLHGRDHLVVSSWKHQAALATTENKPICSPNKQDETELSQKHKDFICHYWTQMHCFARPCSRHEHITRSLQAVQAEHILRTKFIPLLRVAWKASWSFPKEWGDKWNMPLKQHLWAIKQRRSRPFSP